jgi:hypothetical protein
MTRICLSTLLFTLALAACSRAAPPMAVATATLPPPANTAIVTIAATPRPSPTILTSTYTSEATQAPAPTDTTDVCAHATDPGARQTFTLEQIVPCLKTIDRVTAFMANNVEYDVEYDIRERGGNEYVPAPLVYQRGIDDADGYAILQCYFLEENDWDAFMIGFSIESPTGSNVCGVNIDKGIIALDGPGQMAGPFNSFTDLADFAISIHWMQRGGSLRTLKASQVTQITTNTTSPSVLELPWVSHPY